MKKLIVKVIDGKEYLYSRHDTYQANQSKIEMICKALNNARYNLKNGEKWHIYTVDDTEYKYAAYKFAIRNGKLFTYEIWRACNFK